MSHSAQICKSLCNYENNVPSQLSSQWLINSTWVATKSLL